jgi:hypothetical protein
MSPNEQTSSTERPRDVIPTIGRRYLDAVDVLRGRAVAVTPDVYRSLVMDMESMKMEWMDVQEKLNTWAARVAKREQRALKRLAAEEEQTAAPAMNGPSHIEGLFSGPALPD